MVRALCWSDWAKTVMTESQGCVETLTIILQMTKSYPMAHWHKMIIILGTAGSHPPANQGELQWKSLLMLQQGSSWWQYDLSFPDVAPLMKMMMDWMTVPLEKNIPNSAVSSPTPPAHSAPATCTLTPSHFSLPVSTTSASTLQPMACCVPLSPPMRKPALF